MKHSFEQIKKEAMEIYEETKDLEKRDAYLIAILKDIKKLGEK